MGALQKNDEALKKANVVYHKFLGKYKPGEKQIYIFVEGDEDIAYYSNAILHNFPKLRVVKFIAGDKEKVLELNKYINWEFYNKHQLLFFVDRDMSYWMNMHSILPDNVYVTDEYSIENDVVKEEYFMEYLQDLCGFATADEEELENIRELYHEKWEAFVDNSYYIMAAVAISLKHTGEHLAKEFAHERIIRIGKENIWRSEYNNQSLNDYIDQIFRIAPEYKEEIEILIGRFREEPQNYSVRGKWALSFLVKMIKCVVQDRKNHAPSLYREGTARVGCLVNIEEHNAMTILGTRIPVVASLNEFCDMHIKSYLSEE